MKEILINVSKETRMVDLNKSVIGNDGENLQGKLVFTFIDDFVNGRARLECEIKGERKYIVLNKENNSYTIPIKNVITKEGQIDMQLVITEGINEEEIPVFKSNKFYLYCNSSINAVEEAPDGYELWIEQANVILNQIDNIDIDMQDSTVIITKKDGTKISKNVKGEKGEKGDAGSVKFIIANELPTEEIDDSAIYMIPSGITSEGNTYEEYIYANGRWESLGSASVNVDLADYIKKTDYVTNSTAGIVRTMGSYGIVTLNPSTGLIGTQMATNDDIDAKTNNYKPIVPSNLDYAIKKALSANSLEWTDAEKESVRNLLDLLTITPLTNNTNLNGVYGVFKNVSSSAITITFATAGTTKTFSMNPNEIIISTYTKIGTSTGQTIIQFTNTGFKLYVRNINTGSMLTANIETFLKTTGSQSISGTKTFNALPKSEIVPTEDTHFVNKKYVDDKTVTLTQTEYDDLTTKDENVYYYIVEE